MPSAHSHCVETPSSGCVARCAYGCPVLRQGVFNESGLDSFNIVGESPGSIATGTSALASFAGTIYPSAGHDRRENARCEVFQ
jgi:hypothetical protein